jgi:LysM repeat protein
LITTTPAAVLITVTAIAGPATRGPESSPATATAAPQGTPRPQSTAAAPTSVPPTSAAPSGPTPAAVIHVVQANDTVWGIAQKYGLTVDEVLAANQMDRTSVLQIGQRLIIPPKH